MINRCILIIAAGLLAQPLEAQRLVPGTEKGFPRVQYADSTISVNDRCIVRLKKLNRRMPPVYVNGFPIGFC